MYSMLKMAVLGCALLMVTPLFVMGGDKPAKGEKHGKHGDMIENMLGKLNLTDDQKAKVKEIREKYRPEFQEFEKAHKEQIEAAKQARDHEKLKELMKPIAGKREAMMKEIRGVLTDEQKAEMHKAFEGGKGGHGKKHGDKQ